MNMKSLMLAAVIGCFWIVPVIAAEKGTDVRGVALKPEGLKVVEEKCLVCHNRQRIDDAVRERREMESILKAMEQKGTVITEEERKIIGHFWGQKVFK
jgi:uncharacterized protein YebE (UPF0316 family)